MSTAAQAPHPPALWKSVGVWMATIVGAMQLVNALRAFADPGGFANYLGIPLLSSADAGLIQLYGLRALFLGLFVLYLIYTRQLRVVAWMAALALVMPVGDVWLVHQAGAPATTVLRHALIGVFLLLTAVLLFRQTNVRGGFAGD